ncbi:hypothetical protein PG985_002728 [Apiospora marii]|uniref:uncharacterized protein n=1 Tax=Apiospora marii TaxID=335849 RepID=UPI00312FD602
MQISKLALSAAAIAASIVSSMPSPGQHADVQSLGIRDDDPVPASGARSRGGGDGKRCDVYDFGVRGKEAYAICPGH